MELNSFNKFKNIFLDYSPIFQKNFERMEGMFGEPWRKEFDLCLKNMGEGDEAYRDASKGYSMFAIDAMRLQRLFNKKLSYEDVSYEEACEKVYHNQDYMMKLYLPGIFVSNFLWIHHYRQLIYYKERFLPLLDNSEENEFYDVGTGTGFYSVQALHHKKDLKLTGVDISQHSRQFTLNNINSWGFGKRFTSLNANIIDEELEPKPFVQCIEVLEHLPDPVLFLKNLRLMLKDGGHGFITAALTAPNADHIYLYWEPSEIIEQLEEAGFNVIEHKQELAYEGKEGEHVPKVAAFIVS